MEQIMFLCGLSRPLAAMVLLIKQVGEYEVTMLNDTPDNALTLIECSVDGIANFVSNSGFDYTTKEVKEFLKPADVNSLRAQVAWLFINLIRFSEDLGLLDDELLTIAGQLQKSQAEARKARNEAAEKVFTLLGI